jgi:hypothetical protein
MKTYFKEPGMVAHICNLSNSEGRGRRIKAKGQHRQKAQDPM